eukprot:CAMPEP_0182417580 /NCGR_PEP_ID=MMETSP1167-20130531/2045_1 /TAXON_ID=2988 /ORGANISM="Mallomonas Sp, Strain CCMP3275" /LENGTH=390 /DNA_ID=CAMNT_0024591245 /DNA_START=43 /DNA_END=1215 /DNA_ORIENTATION=-
MFYSFVTIAFVLAASVSAVVTDGHDCKEHPRSTAVDRLSWSYEPTDMGDGNGNCSPDHMCGPSMWKDIVPTGATVNECGGSEQTPIDLRESIVTGDINTKPTYVRYNDGCHHWTSFVDDHALEVNFAKDGHDCPNYKMMIGGKTYNFIQLHFHAPSEHTMDGHDIAAEVHLVHVSDAGELAVVGVFLEKDDQCESNPMLEMIWESTHDTINKKKLTNDPMKIADRVYCEVEVESEEEMNPYEYVPETEDFYRYHGSLTTYPCSEGVLWTVYRQPVRISSFDLTVLQETVKFHSETIISKSGSDARPVEPVGSRDILYYEDPSALVSMKGGKGGKKGKCGPKGKGGKGKKGGKGGKDDKKSKGGKDDKKGGKKVKVKKGGKKGKEEEEEEE